MTSSSSSVDISGLPPGEYKVSVTDPEGCSAEASVTVTSTLCGIPRGISPDNDGSNDYFDLSYLDIQELLVFNRHGLKVYQKENYKNEWYGQSDKGELPTGTYYYVVTLFEGKRVTGWVYLQMEAN
ncbi:gliding motility-associated C-terminal domain-containing protein [Flavobacterium sp.]|uniref:gliding motility-associated C-terminal domain-containing protein n=1 Tax=Flavobacterium sp. TaxID=239 RepID=UPI0040332605